MEDPKYMQKKLLSIIWGVVLSAIIGAVSVLLGGHLILVAFNDLTDQTNRLIFFITPLILFIISDIIAIKVISNLETKKGIYVGSTAIVIALILWIYVFTV